jgi:Mlc titration factor MtfA (ptsG expression regulator)
VGLIQRLLGWRRKRILQQASLDPSLWRATLERYPYTRVLDDDERDRLHDLVALFLHEKAIHGAGGMVVDDAVRLAIAVQACILVRNLGLESYRGWVEIIVYPDEFVAEYEWVDEAGVSHDIQEPMTGESWSRGPVILSWADAEEAGRGTPYNVVIHEFAHKLDMLNGEANGFPPLHADMARERWAEAFTTAYADFSERVERGVELEIDDYAAETPAEFFAVMSEAFFECPDVVRRMYPDVYEQLSQFYRQDPLARRGARARSRA